MNMDVLVTKKNESFEKSPSLFSVSFIKRPVHQELNDQELEKTDYNQLSTIHH